MKVQIDADGRLVEIECSEVNMTTERLAAEALGLWKATDTTATPRRFGMQVTCTGAECKSVAQ